MRGSACRVSKAGWPMSIAAITSGLQTRCICSCGEKVVPTLGVVLIDLAQRKTDGKIFGYQGGDFGTLSNFPIGAHAQVLNETAHPLGGEAQR